MADGHGFVSSAVSVFILIITVNCALYDDHLRLAYYEESKMNFWRISSNAFIINEDVVLTTWHSASSENNALRHLFMRRIHRLVSATFITYGTPLRLFYFVRKRYLRRRLGFTSNSTATFNPEVMMLVRSGVNIVNPGPVAQINSINEFRSSNVILPGKSGLKIGQWNVNHLTDIKLEEIELLLTSMNYEIHILFVIETFLKPSKPDSMLELPGYTLHRRDRPGQKKGGGIIAYVSNNIKGVHVSELDDDEVESLWLNINPHRSKRPILVGAIYRPPGSTAVTDAKIESNIEAAYLRNQEIYILGDFNINYLDFVAYNNHRLVKALKSLNLTQVIKTVTRPISATCLDHVYTTNPSFIAEISVPNIDLADHLPIFFRRKYCKQLKQNTSHTIKYRDFKNLNSNILKRDLLDAPWDSAFVTNNVNDVLQTVETMLNEILDKHIPFKSKRVKKPSQPAWMTKEIVQSIRQRDNLLINARKSDKPADWANYSQAKNKTTNLIRKSKRKFFREKIDENKGNSRGIWKALRTLSGTIKPPVDIKELITENGTVSDKTSNILNHYFTNIVEQISEGNDYSDEYDDSKLRSFVSSRLSADTTFTIPEITIEQITEIILKFPTIKQLVMMVSVSVSSRKSFQHLSVRYVTY